MVMRLTCNLRVWVQSQAMYSPPMGQMAQEGICLFTMLDRTINLPVNGRTIILLKERHLKKLKACKSISGCRQRELRTI